MAKKISIDQLRDEVNSILKDYADDALEAADAAATQYGKAAVSELKSSSPVDPEGKKSGRYKKGWAYSKERGRLTVSVTVYNKSDGALTHLLEHGHALRQGGRSPARGHIQPVEESVTKEFEENVKKRLSNG